MNFPKAFAALLLAVALIVTGAVLWSRRESPARDPQAEDTAAVEPSSPPPSPPGSSKPELASQPRALVAIEPAAVVEVESTNKLERLEQIREKFRALAAGDALAAMRAAKQITNRVEREAALMTLVTEWTQGDLVSPELRADRIGRIGLDVAIGLELAKHPDLALMWADEFANQDGRDYILQVVARAMVGSDPARAFAFGDQIPQDRRRGFYDALFSDWASKDTRAAIDWAQQMPDADRDAAIQAIRSSAPVGIGAALTSRDGYAVVMDLIPGTPAERSGQLHKGDRILALAEGGGSFVDAHDIPLQKIVEMVRGAPNTVLHLQIAAADAPPNTPPKIVTIVRDQILFKQ